MSETNKDLMRRAWAAYDRGDEDEFAACLTEDWREYDGSGASQGLGEERRTMRLHKVAFPDKRTVIHRIVADDEWVACQSTTTATHSGLYLGVEATGRELRLNEMMFNRVRDGRLCASWAIVDGQGFYEQLTGKTAAQALDNIG
ncbi:MAG TPA: ester cyclase [Acidimicrobiales bacterium]|nr:ester cyclase [Acidimicrobiales bacterium]